MRYSDGVHLRGRGVGAFATVLLAVVIVTMAAAPCYGLRWSKMFDEEIDFGPDLAAVDGGGVIGAGQTDDDAWLVLFDDEGVVIWEYTYPVGTESIFRAVIETTGGFCALGFAHK